ncbi:MAG: hypothetical protein IPI53_12820 [Saprospiraceae bacterium]|nr:hypothetical protein [Saprospiraceae bacterium]
MEKWANGFENYTFEEDNGTTTVTVDLDTTEEFVEYMTGHYPKALQEGIILLTLKRESKLNCLVLPHRGVRGAKTNKLVGQFVSDSLQYFPKSLIEFNLVHENKCCLYRLWA